MTQLSEATRAKVPAYQPATLGFPWPELAGVRIWCSHLPSSSWPVWMRPDNPPQLLISALHFEQKFIKAFMESPIGGFLDPDVPAEMAMLRLIATFPKIQVPMVYRWVKVGDRSYKNWVAARKEGEHRLAHLIMRAWQEEAEPLVENWIPAAKAQLVSMQVVGHDRPTHVLC